MPSAFKIGVQKLVHNLQSSGFIDEPCGQRNHVTIVVLTAEVRYLRSPTKSTTDMRIFVHGHLNTVPATTNHNTATVFTLIDGAAQKMRIIGIIDTFSTVGAKIFYLKALILKILFYSFLQFISSMIACHSNYFFHNQTCL